MLEAGAHKVLPVIPQLIIPLKTALNTREKTVIVKVKKNNFVLRDFLCHFLFSFSLFDFFTILFLIL